MNVKAFIKLLEAISLPDVFNPYRDTCPIHDKTSGAQIRVRNLRKFLDASLHLRVDTIWMGRDLGYRGGRRTGIALTDEAHLPVVTVRFPGCQLEKATRGEVVAERTATEIWSALSAVPEAPFLWNVFPLHPHEHNMPMTNRKFSRSELQQVETVNDLLISGLGIKRIIAIGQDAARYAERYCPNVVAIRHPSYGGVSDFRRGVEECYGLAPLTLSTSPLQQPLIY
jgi:hypothetical protein